ncbi:hypothetical protein GW17_00027233 [Ensete ventricosum]|nr:hypothetical protein GW17_00027233 [Ensete ventricosum]
MYLHLQDVKEIYTDFLAACLLQITEIPNLTAGCTEFIESAQQILEQRKLNQTLLANHTTLLDLLEIPQLMDTYPHIARYGAKRSISPGTGQSMCRSAGRPISTARTWWYGKDDVSPPSVLMEHPPVAVFVNGVSAAMNELRPCAPVSLKYNLAQEVVKGLQAVSDSLVRYNAMRVLRRNESTLFLSLCQAFIEVS